MALSRFSAVVVLWFWMAEALLPWCRWLFIFDDGEKSKTFMIILYQGEAGCRSNSSGNSSSGGGTCQWFANTHTHMWTSVLPMPSASLSKSRRVRARASCYISSGSRPRILPMMRGLHACLFSLSNNALFDSLFPFVCRINVKDHSLDISFEEWRDYLLFHPSADLADIIQSWRHNTVRYKRIMMG